MCLLHIKFKQKAATTSFREGSSRDDFSAASQLAAGTNLRVFGVRRRGVVKIRLHDLHTASPEECLWFVLHLQSSPYLFGRGADHRRFDEEQKGWGQEQKKQYPSRMLAFLAQLVPHKNGRGAKVRGSAGKKYFCSSPLLVWTRL